MFLLNSYIIMATSVHLYQIHLGMQLDSLQSWNVQTFFSVFKLLGEDHNKQTDFC